jgi:electron transfer flavoprotein beta subunit
MRILVCVKQIPDPANPSRFNAETHRLVRTEDQILDDTDRYGVEMGLRLAEASEGTVTLLSMGPVGRMQGIRQALAMGADQAVMIEDDTLEGSDALTTARILAAAAERTGFDLIICGTESTDGYSGVVPQMVAELLGVAALTYATSVEAGDGQVIIHRQTSAGYDVVKASLPAVVSVTAGVVEPRYPTFRGIMQAKRKPAETLDVSDLGVAVSIQQQVVAVSAAPERQAGVITEDEGEGHLLILEKLQEVKVI